MKKTVLFIILTFFMPFVVNAQSCISDKVTIESVTIDSSMYG